VGRKSKYFVPKNEVYSPKPTYKTPCEAILKSALGKMSREQAIVSIILLFEIQEFCNDKDLISAINLFGHFADKLSDQLEYIKYLYPFVNNDYSQTIQAGAVLSICSVLNQAIIKHQEIPNFIYDKVLKVARKFLNDNILESDLANLNLDSYVRAKINLIEILMHFKPKDSHPIFTRVTSKKKEIPLIIKVTKSAILGEIYEGDDLDDFIGMGAIQL